MSRGMLFLCLSAFVLHLLAGSRQPVKQLADLLDSRFFSRDHPPLPRNPSFRLFRFRQSIDSRFPVRGQKTGGVPCRVEASIQLSVVLESGQLLGSGMNVACKELHALAGLFLLVLGALSVTRQLALARPRLVSTARRGFSGGEKPLQLVERSDSSL